MIKGEDLKTFKNIEAYILGKLSESEVDELWIQFLKKPVWLDYLEIEVNIRAIIMYNLHK